jgi:hypothetical protein
VPLVDVGSSVSESGACCGVSVTCVWSVVPFKLAPIVTGVFVVTASVGMLRETEKLPAGIVALDGTLASAASLLVRLTTVPPAGAWPFSMTISVGSTPPVIVLGEMVRDCKPTGCTTKLTEAEVPLIVAVSVTGVATFTAPTWKLNPSKAKPAGTVQVAGTGAAARSLLVRLTTAPPVGAGPVSWTYTVCVWPFAAGSLVTASDPTPGGVEGTTNDLVADQAVLAGTPGAESPCVDSTCQYLVPAVSEVRVQLGPVI